MSSSPEQTQARPEAENTGEGLREVLLRLTSPRYAALHEKIETLQDQIDALLALEANLASVEAQLVRRDETLDQRLRDLQGLLQNAQTELSALASGLAGLDSALRAEISHQSEQVQAGLERLESDLTDPQEIQARVSPVLIRATDEQVQENEAEYAAAVAPVIGPAIRQQIRTARQDIIDAIYPIIGQIVGKAIAEELRELTRKIDAQLRRQLNIRARLQLMAGRLRGVSAADQLLREALPYDVRHVFLIHRKSGLLLHHLAASGADNEDADLISGMLTAIQDFVRDSFGGGENELEEITHGDQRILLEGGQYAYVAVVLEGVEPPGYAGFMRYIVSEINVQHEAALSEFNGAMAALPPLEPPLLALASPTGEQLLQGDQAQPLGRGQKWLLAGGILGIMLLIALVIFGCIFTYRLWPLAFPGAASRPTSTPTAAILPTATLTLVPPTTSPTPLPSATLEPTVTITTEPPVTASPVPTSTDLPTASPTPALLRGTLTGNLNVREQPSTDSRILATILSGEQVLLLDQQGEWYLVRWPVEGEVVLEGWVWGQFVELQ